MKVDRSIFERHAIASGVREQWSRNGQGVWFKRHWLAHTGTWTAWRRVAIQWKLTVQGNRLLVQDTSHPASPVYIANKRLQGTSNVPPGR